MRCHPTVLCRTVLGLLVAVALLGSLPAAADEWLRLDVTSTGRAMWIDLESQRYGWLGDCDEGRALQRLSRTGDRVELELNEVLQADLGRGQLAVEQRLVIEVQGRSATLRVRSRAAGDLITLPLRVEWLRRRTPPGCGS